MILVDSNIPMFLVGATHPNKGAARRLLEQCITRGERLVTDAEVLQEILHRYVAINRRDAIQPAFDALLGVVDHIYPIELGDIERAKALLLGVSPLSARDAVHVAIMQRYEIDRILSFDTGFDTVEWIDRLA
ncbi:putative nucleic acid-binding protein, contains PIN domain [Luteitalea pratensis]|uniref:Ribonuclease VapC n=1 Tax=Luteitalea pratensis TaxID=1855912 RepID=A0A143PGR1_LUTPR|nr:type II toxin-antitoxin system VapC family toxin [Luteitalea pratensis]AMY07606.1 putative nucleic acid-binding protein, contains PIN domain [Luteitalea pratensis]